MLLIDNHIRKVTKSVSFLKTSPLGLPAARRMGEYLVDLEQAAAYSLDEDTVLFLDTIAPDMSKTAATFGDVKLPHECFSVEFPFPALSRQRCIRGGFEPSPSQMIPDRIGILVHPIGDDPYATIFTTNTVDSLGAISIPLHKMRPSTEGNASLISHDVVVHTETPLSTELLSNLVSETINEIPIVLVLILFLTHSDRDTIEIEDVPAVRTYLDRSKGLPARKAHRRIKLGEFGRMHMQAVEQHEEEQRSGRRAHFVRGHYFRYEERLIWRRPHIRGGQPGDVPDAVRSNVTL